LHESKGEEYALNVVFMIRTAVELHRAWHMTLLTNRVLQQLKDKFKLHMTWDLGVIDLKFLVEDGLYELHRRVPYDYDSEFQNMYEKTAVALIEESISVHDALIFQMELKNGMHTSKSGLFLRNNPGRLVLYPLQAATCCVIFFGGDWRCALVAAVCGIIAGLIEWVLSSERFFANVNDSKVLIDFLIGFSTGVTTAFFYVVLPNQENFCIISVFLGTLYWFFYGTAFVLGLLEIIAGELQTGVTRFLAVSVKTFVLSIGSAIGLILVLHGHSNYDYSLEDWNMQFDDQLGVCNTIDLDDMWWRLPLYILCSISVLGQYRFIFINYWMALLVQVAGYEAQYKVSQYFNEDHKYDGMDRIFGDMAGAIASVVAASIFCFIYDYIGHFSNYTVLSKASKEDKISAFGHFMRRIYECFVSVNARLGLGRRLWYRTRAVKEKLEELSTTQGIPKHEVKLSVEEESTLVEAAIEAQDSNVWSLLMPAVYQLVPGSQLARYWYSTIFPSQKFDNAAVATNATDILDPIDSSRNAYLISADTPQSALWLTSVSIAVGLILGLTVVRIGSFLIVTALSPCRNRDESEEEVTEMEARMLRVNERRGVTNKSVYYDPADVNRVEQLDPIHGDSDSSETSRQEQGTTPSPNESEEVVHF